MRNRPSLARRLCALAALVGALVLTVACGGESTARDPRTSDPAALVAAIAALPDSGAVVWKVGDTLRTATALVGPPGQTQALKSVSGGRYLVARSGVMSFVQRQYRGAALVRADTFRYPVSPPAPAVVVAVTTECPSVNCPTFNVPTNQRAFATVTRSGRVDSAAVLGWGYAPASVCVQNPDTPAQPYRFRAVGAGTCTVTARDAASGVSGSARVAVTSTTASADTALYALCLYNDAGRYIGRNPTCPAVQRAPGAYGDTAVWRTP